MHGIVTIHKLNAQAAQANTILEKHGETARVLTSADFAKPAPEVRVSPAYTEALHRGEVSKD